MKIDTLKEKIELYYEVKRRLAVIKKLEEQAGGVPIAEARELIKLMIILLDKIRSEIVGEKGEDIEEIKRRLFGGVEFESEEEKEDELS